MEDIIKGICHDFPPHFSCLFLRMEKFGIRRGYGIKKNYLAVSLVAYYVQKETY